MRAPLFTTDRIGKLSNELTEANTPIWAQAINPALAAVVQWTHKRKLIDARRNEVLGGLCRELEAKIQPFLKRDPKVLGIRLSVFGFSRGAAEARVFSNWFVDMCHAASGGLSIAGLKVDFDFVGIFDTVASVGLANSTVIADGHMEWADAERSLRIPAVVKQCVHLVSAHEVRRSFPLDSIAEASDRRKEIVYPGVHSDLGGGYRPCEQGRGTDPKGNDLLSRIALAHMYREARLANVPLDVDGEGVAASAKAALTVADSTRIAFNAYLDQCKVKKGSLAEILDEQTRLYVRWRRLRLDLMDTLASVRRACPQDRTDILEANRELVDEARLLKTQLPPTRVPAVNATAIVLRFVQKALNNVLTHGIDAGHYDEWKRLEPDWDKIGGLPAEVSELFDNYVHDSRAWFKPLGDDDDVWDKKQLQRMKTLEEREQAVERERKIYEESDKRRAREREEQRRRVMTPTEEENRNPAYRRAMEYERSVQMRDGLNRPAHSSTTVRDFRELSESEKQELAEWRRSGKLATQPKGREPFTMGGGYLRYRRVYYGSDTNIVMKGGRERPSLTKRIFEIVAA